MKRIGLILVSFILLLTSCNKNEANKESFQKIRANVAGEPATMDPRKGGDLTSSAMHFLLFEGLTRQTPNGSIRLAHAEKVDLSSDRKVYTFHIRDCEWSDGTKVSAYDYEKSWKDILDPNFPSINAHLLYPITNAEAAKKGIVSLDEVGIKAIDDKTLVVVLETPTPYFLELISFCVFFPVNRNIDAKCQDWAKDVSENFVTSGPFLLKKWKHNNEIVLEKNPKYYRRDEIALDLIHFTMVDNEMTALQMYENGELDILGAPLTHLPVDALPQLAKGGLLQIRPAGGTTFCAFNIHKFPFNNVHIRKAFALAVNREAIVKNITQLDEIPALGAIPPILKKDKNVAFFQDADQRSAKEHLQIGMQELGITLQDLNSITYSYSTAEVNHKIAQALQQQWMEVLGIKVKLENQENKVLMGKLNRRDYTMAQTMWLAQYNDQMNILERFKSKDNVKNYSGWENSEYRKLLDQSAWSVNSDERLETLEKAEAIFIEEMPVAPLFHWSSVFVAKPYVKNFDLAAMGNGYFEVIYIDTNLK